MAKCRSDFSSATANKGIDNFGERRWLPKLIISDIILLVGAMDEAVKLYCDALGLISRIILRVERLCNKVEVTYTLQNT